jgi:hypothetical protein
LERPCCTTLPNGDIALYALANYIFDFYNFSQL